MAETKEDSSRLVGAMNDSLRLKEEAETVAAAHLADIEALQGDVEALQAEVEGLRARQAELPTLLRSAESAAERALDLERSLDSSKHELAATKAELDRARSGLDAVRADLSREKAGAARLQTALRLAADTVRLREAEADALNDTAQNVMLVESGSPRAPAPVNASYVARAEDVEAEVGRFATRETLLIAELESARSAAHAAEARATAANEQVAASAPARVLRLPSAF